MRLGLLTLLWRRPELAGIMLRHTASLRVPGVELVPLAVRSADDPQPADKVPGWTYAWAPNDPLSEKWNAGMLALRMLGVDAVMILGSDDLINSSFLSRVCYLLKEKDSDYLQPGGLWVYDLASNRCMYGEAGRVGAGRVLSKRLLDIVDWRPWTEAQAGKTDQAMDETLDPIVWPYVMKQMPKRGEVLLDVKTSLDRCDEQVWTFDDLSGLTLAKYEGETFLNYHFPNVSKSILSLQQPEVNHAPVN